jgi:hypothetical protein
MTQRFGAILLFYKPYFLWSLAINILLIILKYNLFILSIVKILLIGFLWYFITETNGKRKLIFYNNLGISSLRLFSTLFLIDIFITLLFFNLITAFL